MDAEALNKRLEPTHLTEDDADVKAKVEALEKRREPDPEQDVLDDPRARPEYTFDFNYVDARGKAWLGKFTTKILNEKERRQVGIMRSMLAGSQSYESLDPMTRDSCLIHAHLAYCLKAKPKWAENLGEILDPKIVQALFEEVLDHEQFFLLPQGASRARQAQGQ